MTSTVRCISSKGPETVMGEVEEKIWTTIAAEHDGVVQHDQIGRQTRTRRVHFAFRQEALDWVEEQIAEGYEARFDPCPSATAYFGETDSSSNCWLAEVEREEASPS